MPSIGDGNLMISQLHMTLTRVGFKQRNQDADLATDLVLLVSAFEAINAAVNALISDEPDEWLAATISLRINLQEVLEHTRSALPEGKSLVRTMDKMFGS